MRVVISGGGTAGHIYPALTVAAKFVAEHDDVTFIGTPAGLEARLVPEAGVAFTGIPSRGLDRSRPWTLLSAAFTAGVSTIRVWRLFRRNRPDVVIGFGAYVSLPVGVAAVLAGVPLVLHEQNSVPGLANKVLSRWATSVGVTYEESKDALARPNRAVYTGNPVRGDVLSATRLGGRERLGLRPQDVVLLVFGGSRGARHLNSALVSLKDRLMSISGLCVLHVTGPKEAESVRGALRKAGGTPADRWRVFDYLDGMGDAIAAADLVVSRAGATTIAELMVLGAPAVLVPYPFATDDHQTKNARALLAHDAAVLVADEDVDDSRFGDTIVSLINDPERRANMSAATLALGRPDAAERVVTLARNAASAGGSHNRNK